VGKESLREAVLAVFARYPSRRFNAGDVMKSSGVSLSCIYKYLEALVASGEIVKDAPGVYHWPTSEDVKTAPASPPAPAAPVIPPPEQPADVEAAPESLPPQVGPPPFAGVATTFIGSSMSHELRTLDDLEQLDDATRDRVLRYAFSRWPGELDIVREVEVRYPNADRLATEILDTLDRYARTAP